MTNNKYHDYYSEKGRKFTDRIPVEVELEDLTKDETFKLIESKYFCILPWLHMHGWPNGDAYSCCLADMDFPIGNLRENSIEELWNSNKLKELRKNIINDKPSPQCHKCYEQEESGFFSSRNANNKTFAQHINLVKDTEEDGTYYDFKLRYWDIRFSNICNYKCRSCGPPFSSKWFEDEKELVKIWTKNEHAIPTIKKFQYCGKDKDDIWNQIQPHISYVEKIYFAGGEPLITDEHYKTLHKLIKLGKTDVRLVYNTNMSELSFKNDDVLPLWREFESVSIGASLDASGARAELMRKGTDWKTVCNNRERIMKEAPDVDFYVSSTLSLMNAMHMPDFHAEWIDKGFITANDININILQGPTYYRIDNLPIQYKELIINRYNEFINNYLKGKDKIDRATAGYNSAINFIKIGEPANNNNLLEFLRVTKNLDEVRNENFFDVFTELRFLQDPKTYE